MRHKTVGSVLMIIGVCLILSSGLMVGYNTLEDDRAEESVVQTMTELKSVIPEEVIPAEKFAPEQILLLDQAEPTVDVPYYVVNPKIEMPVQEINGIPYIGVLAISDLGLELPVISQWSKANARTAPCRYTGSVYLDNMIICAHNYKSHFGKLSSLSIGDSVFFTDMEGNQFQYHIVEFEVMDGAAIEQMNSGNWDLTLFTCTLGGKSRLAVRCQRTDKKS